MMPILNRPPNEVDQIQNPGVGAYLLWQFTLGHQEDALEPAPFLLSFLILPMLLHQATFNAVASTRKSSGLLQFVAKFDKEREILVELHGRTRQLRQLSLQSIGVATACRLVNIDYEAATLYGYSLDLLEYERPFIPERLKGFQGAANKIGYWFSKLSTQQIASSLRISF